MLHPQKTNKKAACYSYENYKLNPQGTPQDKPLAARLRSFIFQQSPLFHIKMNIWKLEGEKGEERMNAVVKRIQMEEFRYQINSVFLKFCSVSA